MGVCYDMLGCTFPISVPFFSGTLSPVNSLLPGIPFLLLGESCSPSLDPPGQFLGGNSHPWGISVTFQNTKNHVHSIVLSWLKGQY